MKTEMNTDQIERTIVLKAPRARVWQAISQADQFGAWFGMALDGAFVPGARIAGHLTELGWERLALEMVIEQVEPESQFSFHWHPFAVDPNVDYSTEPMTLVEFQLSDEQGGTRVTVTESGFDQIPLARRATAFRMNDEGWAAQLENLKRYVDA